MNPNTTIPPNGVGAQTPNNTPPQQPPQNNNQQINTNITSGGKIFEINFENDTNNGKIITDQPIQLITNTDTNTKKEFPFRKEIKVCTEVMLTANETPNHAKASLISGMEGSYFYLQQ
jgi:hypothetical protein